MSSKTSRSSGIDLSDFYCHETLDDLDAEPAAKQAKRTDKGLDILLEAIDHMNPVQRLPIVAEPVSPEKAPLRLIVPQLERRPLSDLVKLRSFAMKAKEVYSELNQRDLTLMAQSKKEGSLGKADSYHRRSERYQESEQDAKRIQRDTTSSLANALGLARKSDKSNFN
ncbi:MAG: hypothetical protein JSR39_01400 [Verrucomicrobia bacterium]|nr:hypothetical protein [Verrucomicrobiota bacterium]